MKKVNGLISLRHKINTLEKIFGKGIDKYPVWWIENYYTDFMFYNCTPEKYRKLIKTRG